MSQEFKEKSMPYMITGVFSTALTLAVVAVVVAFGFGFRYKNIVMLNPEQVVKEEVQSEITLPEAELLTKMHDKGILMTPNEYTGHLATYYDTLVAFFALFFVIFTVVGYWGIRSMSRKEVVQTAKEVLADSHELRSGIKTMIMGEIDEDMVHRDDFEQEIASIRESLEKCVYVMPEQEKKGTIIDPEKPKKDGSKRKKNAASK